MRPVCPLRKKPGREEALRTWAGMKLLWLVTADDFLELDEVPRPLRDEMLRLIRAVEKSYNDDNEHR